MLRGLNTRVLGATIVGLALVCGAATLNSLQSTPTQATSEAAVVTTITTPRDAIAVRDSNNDGVEDWREPFLTASPVILSSEDNFERSDNLTEQAGIALMEQFLLNQAAGPVGTSQELLVQQAVAGAYSSVINKEKPTLVDLTILPDTSTSSVRNYSNTLAIVLQTANAGDARHELLALRDAVTTGEEKYRQEISAVASMYKRSYEQALAIPVPDELADEHLAIITALHGLYYDISDMTEPQKDPLKALVRIKAYEENAKALGLSLQSLHSALTAYPTLFTVEDPALYFARFSDLRAL